MSGEQDKLDEHKADDQADNYSTNNRQFSSFCHADASQSQGRPSSSNSSAPIDIRQASSGKFGVLQARPAPVDTTNNLMMGINGEPVPIDKLIRTANTMSSLMMAHKIALEDDFKLEPGMDISGPLMSLSPIIGSSPSNKTSSVTSSEPSLHNRVKDIVHEAYWDLFKEELDSQKNADESERKYDVSKQLLGDVRQKILDLLLPQHAKLKQDIEDRLDAQIISQLAQVHSLELVQYGHFILGVLSKLCAPVRDDKLKELSETTDVVQLYRGIMELLELMRLDLANFTLNRFKPHIKAHSQDYEREKFSEILNQQKAIGIDGLEYTRVWLERAIKRVDSIHGITELILDEEHESSTSNLDEASANETTFSKEDKVLRSDIVNRVLNSAYCELLEWTPQTQKLYPETLLFDEGTFKQLAEQYKVLLLTSSILLTTFAFTNRFKIQESNEFKVLIKSHIITLLTATYDTGGVTQNSSSNIRTSIDEVDSLKLEAVVAKLSDDIRQKLQESDATCLQMFEQQKDLYKRQILDLQNSSNRVRELARRRIMEFVETLLDLDVKHQRKKYPSKVPPPVNIPLGLNCLTDEITLTMAQLVKIIRYNRRVFFQHYQDIIVENVCKIVSITSTKDSS